MILIDDNIQKLEEIKTLLRQIPRELYIRPKEILSQATIGQHFRHILEFYICLEKGIQARTVCYDNRERDVLIETETEYAIYSIEKLTAFLRRVENDYELTMQANYSTISEEKSSIRTTFYRELGYVFDHTVHHLAIIKIALSEDPVQMDCNFGVAPSTVRCRKVCAQ